MASTYHVNPRIRAYGKARVDITRRAKDEKDWQTLWKAPRHSFPFTWEGGWKQCIEYQVDDFAAEVGFFIDFLGLTVGAFSPSYAMFTSPDQEFAFSVAAVADGERSTPPDTLRIRFMVKDIMKTAKELERRGITFERKPQPDGGPDSSFYTGYFRTPHGICVDLWGTVHIEPALPIEAELREANN